MFRIKDDKYFSFQLIFPPSSVRKQQAGEAETEEREEREAGGGWRPITEVWVTVALGVIVSLHLTTPDIDSFLFSDAVQGHLLVQHQPKHTVPH